MDPYHRCALVSPALQAYLDAASAAAEAASQLAASQEADALLLALLEEPVSWLLPIWGESWVAGPLFVPAGMLFTSVGTLLCHHASNLLQAALTGRPLLQLRCRPMTTWPLRPLLPPPSTWPSRPRSCWRCWTSR